jgi:cytochrome c553
MFPFDLTGGADVLLNFLELRHGVAVKGLENHLAQKALAGGHQLFSQRRDLFHHRRVGAFQNIWICLKGHGEKLLQLPIAALCGVVLELFRRTEERPLQFRRSKVDAAPVGVGSVVVQPVRAGADHAAVDNELLQFKGGVPPAISHSVLKMFQDIQLLLGKRSLETIRKANQEFLSLHRRRAGYHANGAARLDERIVRPPNLDQRHNLCPGKNVVRLVRHFVRHVNPLMIGDNVQCDNGTFIHEYTGRFNTKIMGHILNRHLRQTRQKSSILLGVILVLTASSAAEISISDDNIPPGWAYPVDPPGLEDPRDDGTLRHVPDSELGFSLSQVRDSFLSPDWHPQDHPPMPEIVAHGKKPDVLACGFCHRAEGTGGPENTSLAGLPAVYILQQMADFKSGARKTSVPQRGPPKAMIALAKATSAQDAEAAAAYFSTLKPRPIIQVIETNTVPKTQVHGWHLADLKTGETELIGERIVEVPKNLEQFVSRDSRSRFIAYVPDGSVQKGKALASTGGQGRTVQCAICHGPDLKGLGPIPGIAGRSPSYLVRQLYDFKHEARAGIGSALMKPTVEKLTLEDMVVLAAYAASLPP